MPRKCKYLAQSAMTSKWHRSVTQVCWTQSPSPVTVPGHLPETSAVKAMLLDLAPNHLSLSQDSPVVAQGEQAASKSGMWLPVLPCPKVTRKFKIRTTEHESTCGTLQSAGPEWRHTSHIHEASPANSCYPQKHENQSFYHLVIMTLQSSLKICSRTT